MTHHEKNDIIEYLLYDAIAQTGIGTLIAKVYYYGLALMFFIMGLWVFLYTIFKILDSLFA